MSNHKHKHRAQHRAAAFTVLNTNRMPVIIKIGKRIFRKVVTKTEEEFDAMYKGRDISIRRMDEKGRATNGMYRYSITVTAPNGMYDVNTWEYMRSMDDAIDEACTQALL